MVRKKHLAIEICKIARINCKLLIIYSRVVSINHC